MLKQALQKPRVQFLLLLFCAFLLKQVPYIGVGLQWLETFFHEISHGLAAIFTGGRILQIELYPNGGGLCTTLGGSAMITAFSGYAGAVGWGCLLFLLATGIEKYSHWLSYALLLLLAMTSILWVRDIFTLMICLVLMGLFYSTTWLSSSQFLPVVFKIFALTVLLNALESPLVLFDGQAIGDGAALSSLTFIPEFVWIIIWTLLALFTLFWLSGLGKRNKGVVSKHKGK
ncbi:M50 family metallopeptidase [Thalassotalea aquiviva]|uniref:M50 family metallopeptidase n=1 Tax=Thalassotalea aquiviva TaxID=3242415 RepID=UPI00352B6020